MKAPQDIILKPVITERSMDDLQAGKYTFKVAKDANKVEIRSAVEQLFGVKVAKVNTLNCRGRMKRVGRFYGKTSDWKKKLTRKFSADHQGRRIFLMSPIHHHFEKKGYSETQIVSMYAGVTTILCWIAVLSLLVR